MVNYYQRESQFQDYMRNRSRIEYAGRVFMVSVKVLMVLVLIDACAFVFWVLSGQTPLDSFYLGSFTAHVLGL